MRPPSRSRGLRHSTLVTDWYMAGLEDDVRPRMFEAQAARRPFALATIVDADGGPRPIGAQMVVTEHDAHGFLSGGCIEADVSLHAREALVDGRPRRLVYGRGSPFIDMRLPCGGRLEVLVERVAPDDLALAELERRTIAREPADWVSDGDRRRCVDAGSGRPGAIRFEPFWRFVVVGGDPFALAIADLAARTAWDTTLIVPYGPDAAPPIPARYSRLSAIEALGALTLDRWTGVVVATHDADADHEALVATLRCDVGYAGVLGARRRLADRLARLRAADVLEDRIAALHAPVGLPLGAANAQEVAVAVISEVIACRRQARLAQRAAA